MARFLTLTTISIVYYIVRSTEANNTDLWAKPLSDPKHRNELVDEAFLEQKDVLLEMLESKLKEVRSKQKKKKLEQQKSNCADSKSAQSLVMKANGISNVGVVQLLLNQGISGTSHLKLDADGISNVGQAHLELGSEGGVPGLSNSFVVTPPRLDNLLCNNIGRNILTNDSKLDLNIPDLTLNKTNKEIISRKTYTTINNTTDENNQTTTGQYNQTLNVDINANTTKPDVNKINLVNSTATVNTEINTIDTNSSKPTTASNNITIINVIKNDTTVPTSSVPSNITTVTNSNSATAQNVLNTVAK